MHLHNFSVHREDLYKMWFTICCRCKLFYQRDGKWNEKGVGFLHLKKPDGKAQLVVRADTNLGILSTWIMCGCTYVTLMTCTFNVVSGKVINLALNLYNAVFSIFKNDLQLTSGEFFLTTMKYYYNQQIFHSLLMKVLNNLISGNILLNISLSPSIPLKRQGTNNVYMMCVPNPKISPKDEENKPAAMLVRVKNAEAADELLEKMEDLRKEWS